LSSGAIASIRSGCLPGFCLVSSMFCRSLSIFTVLLLGGVIGPAASAGPTSDARALWSGGVQQLFDRHCVKCHGPLEQKSGLALDTMESALKGDEIGPVIIPGKPEESPMIAALAAGPDPHKPPETHLRPQEIGRIREWTTQLGASGGTVSEPGGKNVTESV